jgi:uncharacterized protein with von Willebrand factor type A (vWA) domain
VSNFQRQLLVFGRLLRSLGLDTHAGRMLDATEALTHVDIRRRNDVYHTLRALLVHRHEDLATFDRVFDSFWKAGQEPVSEPERGSSTEDAEAGDSKAAGAERMVRIDAPPPERDGSRTGAQRTWSDSETLSGKDFSTFTPDEIALGRAALDRLVWQPGLRRTRRWTRGMGPRVDLREALARSLRTGGDPVTLPRLRRRTKPRPLVLLCDVSGSMERYSRMLVHFVHAISRRHPRVEAFLFSTRLTRITRQLRSERLDDALTAVARAVPDWSGGTRIGSALRDLHRLWSRRVLRGGSIVLIVSDGWDRGDPAELRDQMARLNRSCHRVVWLNPLIGTPDYAPLTRGLEAALPFVDDFLPARTLGNLADLAIHLNALDH